MKITQEIINKFDTFMASLSVDEFQSIVDNSRFDLSYIVEEKNVTCLDDIWGEEEYFSSESIYEKINFIKDFEKQSRLRRFFPFKFDWDAEESLLFLDHFSGNNIQYNTNAFNDCHYELVA